MKNTKYAGGGTKNRYIDTLISLQSDNYYLHYITDDSNSPPNWDVEPSKGNFYGTKLYCKRE